MPEDGSAEHLRFPAFAEKHIALRLPFLLCLLAATLPAGCWKSKPEALTPSQIHSITREFAAAASRSGPAGTAVWIANRATKRQPGVPDGVSITSRIDANTAAGRAALNQLVQTLDAVATRHGLTQDAAQQTEDSMRMTFRRGGVATQEIQIFTGARKLRAEEKAERGAPLAIILDDLGSDRAAADRIFALPYPLTLSVLPNHAHSAEIAEEAHRRGYEVMLHLPMRASGGEKPEAEELEPGMPAGELASVVEKMANAVPYAVGVNNHQGSQATSDAALMNELMPVLQQRGLFYIDSRTTATTVAYDAARKDGVRTAFRNVPFLDDVAETVAVRKQLELAMRGAREKGGAIAIGHPHPATL